MLLLYYALICFNGIIWFMCVQYIQSLGYYAYTCCGSVVSMHVQKVEHTSSNHSGMLSFIKGKAKKRHIAFRLYNVHLCMYNVCCILLPYMQLLLVSNSVFQKCIRSMLWLDWLTNIQLSLSQNYTLLEMKYPSISYSKKFLNGANFRIFQTHTNYAKIRTYENSLPEITRLPDSLARQFSVYYGTPGVLVNMIAMYHRLDGERHMHLENLKIRTPKFYSLVGGL